jgi:hypothetical protein
MKAETRPADGVSYWAYILICVDDILCVHHDPGAQLVKLDEYFKMKEGFIQVTIFYLGSKLKKTFLPIPGDQKFQKKAHGPFAGGYKPELDESPELDPMRVNFY